MDACTVKLRGFSATNYLGKVSTSGQAEARWKLNKHWDLVGFAGAGYVANSFSGIRDREAIPSYGVGIRFMVLKAKRVWIRRISTRKYHFQKTPLNTAFAQLPPGTVSITTIYFLYVSPGKAKTWEEDVLDEDILKDGQTVRVTVNSAKSEIFDIRAEDEDGDTYTLWNVDISTSDVTFTLDDID